MALHNARMSDVEVLGTTRVSFIKRGIGSTNLSSGGFHSSESSSSMSPKDSKVIRLNEIVDLHPITITEMLTQKSKINDFSKIYELLVNIIFYDPHARRNRSRNVQETWLSPSTDYASR